MDSKGLKQSMSSASSTAKLKRKPTQSNNMPQITPDGSKSNMNGSLDEEVPELNDFDEKNELDWFRMENRVRQFFKDNLDPIVQTMEGNGMNIYENKTSIDSIKPQLEEVQFKAHSNFQKIKMLEDNLKRVKHIELEQKTLEVNFSC